MKFRIVAACAAVCLMLGMTVASEVKSGLEVGQSVSAFHPHNVVNVENPSNNGKPACLVCQYGTKPVALVFARKDSESVTTLVKKLDEAVKKAGQAKMSAAVIYLSDDETTKGKVETVLKNTGVKNVSLAVDEAKGPEAYKLNKEAEVTVLLYNQRKILANHAFSKFDDKSVEAVVKDLGKLKTN